MPRTGVGVSRVLDYEKEKGSEFDFKYSFNVSSRFTGIYIYIFIYLMCRVASLVLSLLALLVLYWYKSTNTDAARRITGLHILEIYLDGIHVPVSPLLLDVKSAICADENTVANEDGECRCDLKRQLVSAGGGE